MGQSNDPLTVQISLDHVPEPASSRCEQLCDQGDVFCKKDCKIEECKAVLAHHLEPWCAVDDFLPEEKRNGRPVGKPSGKDARKVRQLSHNVKILTSWHVMKR